jgi:hypothetical protein
MVHAVVKKVYYLVGSFKFKTKKEAEDFARKNPDYLKHFSYWEKRGVKYRGGRR